MLRLVACLGGIVSAHLRILTIQLAEVFKDLFCLGTRCGQRTPPTSGKLIDLLLNRHALDQVSGALFDGETRIAVVRVDVLGETFRKKQTDKSDKKQILPKVHSASSCLSVP